jgi:hypothetical protein
MEKMKNRMVKIILILLAIALLIAYVMYRFRNIDIPIGVLISSQNIQVSKKYNVFISEYVSSQNIIEGEDEKYGIKEVWSEWVWLFKDQDLTVEKTNKIQLLIALDKPIKSAWDINYFKNLGDRPGGHYSSENLVVSLDPNEAEKDTITVFFLAKKDTIPISFVKKN